MSGQPLERMSPEAYLAFERRADVRHQYVEGEAFAMAGASERHNLIVTNLLIEVGLQLRDRPCRVYPGDLRVAVSEQGPFYYPDVAALCAEPRFLDAERDTLLNPEVVVEVLSPPTETFDRGLKFSRYRAMSSLQEVLFVAQDAVRVEHFLRQPDDRWLFSDYSGGAAVLELPSLGCRLELARVYDKLSL